MPVDLLLRRFRPQARQATSSKAPALVLADLFDSARPAAPSDASTERPHSQHLIGGSHRIIVPVPAQATDHLLVVRVEPSAPGCWLSLKVDGVVRRSLLLNMRALVCCHLAWPSIAGAPDLEVSFDTSETADPEAGSTFRVFGVSLVKFAPPGPSLRPSPDFSPDPSPPAPPAPASDAELLRHFVSFGDNCEFGLFQRRHGVDDVGLLRLAAVPFHGLCLALEERFAACYDPDELFFEILQYPSGRREYILKHQRYEFYWHTLVEEASVAPEKILVREYQKLCMLVRMLVESLAAGNHIVAYKSNVALEAQESERLAGLLAPYGRNGLLVVAPARRRGDVGKVAVTASGLMLGQIDKLLPYESANLRASNVWMTLCRKAFESWHGGQADAARATTSGVPVDLA